METIVDPLSKIAIEQSICISLLLRYRNGSGSRMPSRRTLAPRLRRSVDAVDRAMRHLTEAGIVRVEHRRSGEQFLSNRYHLGPTPPAAVAAQPRYPYRQTSPYPSHRGRAVPTPAEEADHDLLEACGITDLDELARHCMTARHLLGKPTARWTARCLAVVINLAVVTRGWPPAPMDSANRPATSSARRVRAPTILECGSLSVRDRHKVLLRRRRPAVLERSHTPSRR